MRASDWAYQALSNLIERSGCVAGYANGLYKGEKQISRFQAVALLNACLERISEVTDELQKLLMPFQDRPSMGKKTVLPEPPIP